MAKRKVVRDAARKTNTTPTESLPDTEFSVEYENEDAAKGFNRNSKKGREGRKSRDL